VFSLDDYVHSGIMTGQHAEVLRGAVQDRKNIVVVGGTSTGKTTLVNALLAEVAKTSDRVVSIEDTRELQCAAKNLVARPVLGVLARRGSARELQSGPVLLRSCRSCWVENIEQPRVASTS